GADRGGDCCRIHFDAARDLAASRDAAQDRFDRGPARRHSATLSRQYASGLPPARRARIILGRITVAPQGCGGGGCFAENEKQKEKKAKDVEAIERVILIAAPPEIVFDFLIKPELVARWIGRSLAREPKAGDRFLVEFSDSGYVARGVYTEVSPPRRIAFTW